MEGFDPHLEAVRMAVASFRPLALHACSEVQAALSALSSIASEPEPRQLLSDGQRSAAHAASFLQQALSALDPYTDIAFPPLRRRLSRYDSPHRVLLAMEGGCTRVGWHARVEGQRLAGVRALYIAIGAALADDTSSNWWTSDQCWTSSCRSTDLSASISKLFSSAWAG